jgi:hypothetical protein
MKRIECAKQLMNETDLDLAEIALALAGGEAFVAHTPTTTKKYLGRDKTVA